MATACPPHNLTLFSAVQPLVTDPRTADSYELELAVLNIETARLRNALAHAEILLSDRERLDCDSSDPLPAWQIDAAQRIASFTPRQSQIMELVLAGHPSKNIASDLGISRRTVENHRAAIMKKTGSKSLPALGRFGMSAYPAIQAVA